MGVDSRLRGNGGSGKRIVQEVIMDIVPGEVAGEVHRRNQQTRN
ncbi:hypothetical protein [Candidatus Cryosericum septentrionale]|nr:hypothetical protein [Candidatus Cryosericum septentrionale]